MTFLTYLTFKSSMLMILLSTLSVIRHLICGNNQNQLLNLNLVYQTLQTGTGSDVLTSVLKKLNWFHLNGQITTGAIDVKMDGSVLEEKSSFKMLCLTFFSKLDWGFYIISIAKSASKGIGTLICSMQFLSPEVALHLYKSTIRPCIEYYCHVWAIAPNCYLELLNKLQKRICKAVGSSFAASLEPLSCRRNVASLCLFHRYDFGRCSSELAQLVPLPYSRGRLLVNSIDCMIFLSPFLDVTWMSMSAVSFPEQLYSRILCLQNAFL